MFCYCRKALGVHKGSSCRTCHGQTAASKLFCVALGGAGCVFVLDPVLDPGRSTLAKEAATDAGVGLGHAHGKWRICISSYVLVLRPSRPHRPLLLIADDTDADDDERCLGGGGLAKNEGGGLVTPVVVLVRGILPVSVVPVSGGTTSCNTSRSITTGGTGR
jgi:hypothetical protein